MNEIQPKLEKRGKFFCPAKWEELYLYLNHGNTNSCHHPIPHKIPINEIKNNVAALHNTSHKLAVQQQMLNNEIPNECHMCWHLEQKNISSDRFVKSIDWQNSIEKLDVNPNHVPKFIEIVFDNLCNLNCSYCDSGQSSKWASILTKTGPWNISSDNRNLYNKIHIKPNSIKDDYVVAWKQWWSQIKNQVTTLKISGGEPLISPNFWYTLDQLEETEINLNVALNSNLSIEKKYLEKLIKYSKKVKTLRIAASIDATGKIAEYTRSGLNFNLFQQNIEFWCNNSPNNCFLNLQSTVNVLSIWGLLDKFDYHIELKNKYGDKIKPFYSTLVRFPEFQSILILPLCIRNKLHKTFHSWFIINGKFLTDKEKIYFKKTMEYLISEDDGFNFDKKIIYKKDLHNFLQKYNNFSNHRYEDVYPEEFVNWLKQP